MHSNAKRWLQFLLHAADAAAAELKRQRQQQTKNWFEFVLMHKVYQFFSMKSKDELQGQPPNNCNQRHTSAPATQQPDSASASSSSHNEIEIEAEVDDEEEDDDNDEEGCDEADELTSSSVRRLVQKFSAKAGKLKRSSTFSSTGTYHENCHGKGILPKMNSKLGSSFEVPFVLTTWSARGSSSSSAGCGSSSSSSTASSSTCSAASCTCSDDYFDDNELLGQTSTYSSNLTANHNACPPLATQVYRAASYGLLSKGTTNTPANSDTNVGISTLFDFRTV